MRGHVLYDGGCGICRHWVTRWERTLARRGLAIAPLQDDWVRERLGAGAALDDDALLRDIRLLLADGTSLAGAEAYRWVLRRIWWTWPLWALSVLPGLRTVFDRAYRAFADRRHRISRVCRLD